MALAKNVNALVEAYFESVTTATGGLNNFGPLVQRLEQRTHNLFTRISPVPSKSLKFRVFL